jgi:hypothetical protein
MPSKPPSNRDLLWHVLAFLGYLALTLAFARPPVQGPGPHLASDLGDPLFNLVVLKWGIHEMRNGLHGFWDMPFFFPAHQVTTYSDHLLGPAAFSTLFTAAVPDPVAAYNLLFLGSFVLCGFNTWYVLRRCGLGMVAAFLGGCMFAFSPFRWDQISHVQVLLMHWIPVTLWSWDRLLAGPSWRRAGAFFLFYVLHVTGGSYLGYMIHFPMLVLLLYRAPALWMGKNAGDRLLTLRVLIPTGAACGAVLAGLYLPYLMAAGHQARTPLEIQIFGATLLSYVTAGGNNWYGHLADPWRRPENSLFAGILPTLLVLLAAWHGWKRHRTPPLRPLSLPRRTALWVLTGLTVLAWVESELRVWEISGALRAPALEILSNHRLGVFALATGLLAVILRRAWGGNQPVRLADLDPWDRGLLVSGLLCFLLTFPLVYLPLMRVIPGLSGMRVPARFYAFVSFSLVYFAARALDRLLRPLTPIPSPIPSPHPGEGRPLPSAVAVPPSPGGREGMGEGGQGGEGRAKPWLVAGLAAALLLIDITPRRVPWEPLPDEAHFPAVYHWLARQNGVRGVLELPFQDNSTDILYMYYATLHWKPLVNGYSGYIPDHYIRLQMDCCYPLPDPVQTERLRDWGVTHVLLHKNTLGMRWQRRWARRWADQPGVAVEYEDEKDRVYRIAR